MIADGNLQDLVKIYINFLKTRHFAQETLEAKIYKLKHFTEYISKQGVKNVLEITKDIILDYQIQNCETLNKTGKANTVAHQNSLLGNVKQFMDFLYTYDYIAHDPSKGISYAKKPRQLPRSILTQTEMRKILQSPDTKTTIGYRDRTVLEVLYSTGIRKSELNNLKLSDVDYNEGYLRIISGKGGKDRVVPLGKIACRYLENYIKGVRCELAKGPKNDYLFLTSQGEKFYRCMLCNLVKKYAKAAKIKKNVHPHMFRHTCATDLLKNKANIRVIQEFLGHASITSTQIYTHLTIAEIKEVHKRCHPREQDNF